MMERPSAGATAVLYNGLAAEMLVAYTDPGTGALHTLQFDDRGGQPEQAELLLQFDWERYAPDGAGIVLPESGHHLTKLDEYWVMWQRGEILFAQSVHHPKPLSTMLPAGEWMIDRPVVTAGQEVHAFGWRGGALVRHMYRARRQEEPEVTVETVHEIAQQPLMSTCAPGPGDNSGMSMIACVDESEENGGITATVLFVRDGKVMELSGKSEGQYRLMRRHKMGVHVGRKARPAITVLTESREDGTYAMLEARFDFPKKECVWKRTRLEFIAPESLLTAAAYYFKTQDAPEPFLLAVNAAGHLISPRRRTTVDIRPDVGPGYGYPILTTLFGRYEAVGTGSEIRLYKF